MSWKPQNWLKPYKNISMPEALAMNSSKGSRKKQSFSKNKKETCTISSYEASITFIQKPYMKIASKENYLQIAHEAIQILSKILLNQIQ